MDETKVPAENFTINMTNSDNNEKMESKQSSPKRTGYTVFYMAAKRVPKITTNSPMGPLVKASTMEKNNNLEKIDYRFETKQQFLVNQIRLFTEDLNRPIIEDCSSDKNDDEIELKSSIYIRLVNVMDRITWGNTRNHV
jgi:hypothetical protein